MAVPLISVSYTPAAVDGLPPPQARAWHFCQPASLWGLLEPDARKRARPVLRGPGRSNAPGLPGELVGEYANKGREWQPKGTPEQVKVHDFIDPVLGNAIPYGVYDVGLNEGWVSVGADHDTAAFAVQTIRRWWEMIGSRTYPEATRLLISADGGGSNSYRSRLWKLELGKLAEEKGLEITVCHLRRALPSGTKSSTGSSPTSR